MVDIRVFWSPNVLRDNPMGEVDLPTCKIKNYIGTYYVHTYLKKLPMFEDDPR